MLKSVFLWLDAHPGSYWWLAAAGTLPLVLRLAGALRAPVAGRAANSSGRWRDALALLLFLFAWRWPFLLVAHEFNMDESQFIGGTLALARDPAFWRGTDGNTSGPLDYYTLLPASWLGLPLDYFTARVVGLLVIAAALFLCHRVLDDIFNRPVAWLGVLPAAVFFATTSDPDFLHYSSETTPIGLTALAAWRLNAAWRTGSLRELLFAAAIGGSLAWAKLQAAPIGAVLVIVALWLAWSGRGAVAVPRLRRAGAVVLAALAPTLVFFGVAALTCGVDAVVRRYFVQNIFYAKGGLPLTEATGYFLRFALDQEANHMARFPMQDGRLFWLVATGAAIVAAVPLRCIWRRERPHSGFVVGGLLTLAALASLLGPRRVSVHYLLFAIIPLTLWLGASAGAWWSRLSSRRQQLGLAAALLLLGALLPLVTRVLQPEPFVLGQLVDHWRHPRSGEAEIARRLAGPNGSIGTWGWANYLYPESGLPPATRDALNQWSIDDTPQRDYYRKIYLADLKASQAPVFVDAVGPDALSYQDRAQSGHESFPELAAYVRQNYELVVDWGRIRIYARPGRAAQAGLDQPALAAARRLRGPFHRLWTGAPEPVGGIEQLPVHLLYRRPALALFPPAQLEWLLDETDRCVAFEYGFRPGAYDSGRTDGAEYFLELVGPRSTRLVFHRLLQPVAIPGDRGLQSAVVPLPPFEPGTRLVLRTASGAHNDPGWDWLYLTRLRFVRSPSYLAEQFPGFNRLPDAATGDHIGYVDDSTGTRLTLHAPCALTFALRGNERILNFTYGAMPSAYLNGGRTDGVTYRVRVLRPDGSVRPVYENWLRPVEEANDQGEQSTTLTLSDIAPGDRLLFELDGGPRGNLSWDQTYLRQLTLK